MPVNKRKRMEFEDSDNEDTKPLVKNVKKVKIEQELDESYLHTCVSGFGAVKKEESEAELDVKLAPPPLPVKFDVLVEGNPKITKTNSKLLYYLREKDFEGLSFDKWALVSRPYFAHLYDRVEIWLRAIALKRIPRETPAPRTGWHIEQLSMAQALVYVPNCAELSEVFEYEAWIWHAMARHFERTINLANFGQDSLMNATIYTQLRAAVQQELFKKYKRWPRTTAPLRPTPAAKHLLRLLNGAPGMWAKDFKRQVNAAVDAVVAEQGKNRLTAARWLVYEKLSLCGRGLHWDNTRQRWEDDAMEALEGPFKV